MFDASFLGLPFGFGAPWLLLSLLLLPLIWWLLRLTPPRPSQEPFPPTRILADLIGREETPARSPWWLTLLRLLMAALVILAVSAPVWNPKSAQLEGEGPLLMLIDNDWAAGSDWESRLANANALIDEAEAAQRPIIALETTADATQKVEISSPDKLRARLASLTNQPVFADYRITAETVRQAVEEFSPTTLAYLSSGLHGDGLEFLAGTFSSDRLNKIIYLPDLNESIIINNIENLPASMRGELMRPDAKSAKAVRVSGLDINALSIARELVTFKEGANTASFQFQIPVELRNQIVRIAIDDIPNAGAVKLLDESNRRRLVGLISGEKSSNAQPLLSPLYYISRALQPFSDIRTSNSFNNDVAVPELIANGISTLILADIGRLPEAANEKLVKWVNQGGTLIRFSGPRLAAAPDDELLPVRIRKGDRNIGGALSWEQPKPVAEFELNSPFFGLEPPREVFVSRQILALQQQDLDKKTWARLTDGTPLITAARMGDGWSVLFHVSSDASWSNLPISGTFVEMLRRIVRQSRSATGNNVDPDKGSFPPLRVLNGQGQLTAPSINTKPLVFAGSEPPAISIANPPGIYGTTDGFRAHNLFNGDADLKKLDTGLFGDNSKITHYSGQQPLNLAPWLLLALAFLLILDCLAVLWMAGQFSLLSRVLSANRVGKSAALLLGFITFSGLLSHGDIALSQTSSEQNQSQAVTTAKKELPADFDFSPALKTRLAYVITGISQVDETSEAGLFGLTRFLTQRTAIEPGEPIGVDISTDELAFYPIIYWPIHTAAEIPNARTMARIDAYMKKGGSILFDTRDQISGFSGGTSASPEAIMLQTILASLDIPPLEPVPDDHVLTKSFFILNQFPGRYTGGDLWVEQQPDAKNEERRPVRIGDGVSSILITSNDLAGAWAIDQSFNPMFPTVPPSPVQREMAYRVGVNLIMYAMTGNYKSDQVHIPALLERLGQ